MAILEKKLDNKKYIFVVMSQNLFYLLPYTCLNYLNTDH